MNTTLDLTALIGEVNSFLSAREGDLERDLQFLQDFSNIFAKRGVILLGAYDIGKNPGGFGVLSFQVGGKVIEAQIPLPGINSSPQTTSRDYVGELGSKPSSYKACYH